MTSANATTFKSTELIALRPSRVIVGEILPNLTSPLMVELGLRLTFSIVLIAGLSFLGFGIQPPSPNWGAMINENRVGLSANPWGVVIARDPVGDPDRRHEHVHRCGRARLNGRRRAPRTSSRST